MTNSIRPYRGTIGSSPSMARLYRGPHRFTNPSSTTSKVAAIVQPVVRAQPPKEAEFEITLADVIDSPNIDITQILAQLQAETTVDLPRLVYTPPNIPNEEICDATDDDSAPLTFSDVRDTLPIENFQWPNQPTVISNDVSKNLLESLFKCTLNSLVTIATKDVLFGEYLSNILDLKTAQAIKNESDFKYTITFPKERTIGIDNDPTGKLFGSNRKLIIGKQVTVEFSPETGAITFDAQSLRVEGTKFLVTVTGHVSQLKLEGEPKMLQITCVALGMTSTQCLSPQDFTDILKANLPQ